MTTEPETTTESKPEAPKPEAPKIQSLWIKPSSWEKLSAIKEGIGLTWSQVIEVMIEHTIQTNIIPEETIEKIKQLEKKYGCEVPDSESWKRAFGITGQWTKTANTLKRIKDEQEKTNEALADLISTIEDHADAVIDSDGSLTKEEAI